MPDTEIHSCPFCGSDELHVYDEPSQADDERLHQVYCLNCRALGPRKYNAPEGVTAWNYRKREAELAADNIHLRKTLIGFVGSIYDEAHEKLKELGCDFTS